MTRNIWQPSTLSIVAFLSLALLGTATAQFNFNLNPQMINSFVGNLLNGLGGQAQPNQPVCLTFNPGSEYKTLQDWCKSLSLADDKFWDEKYRTAAGPAEMGAAFPMQGCVLGCMVGKDAFTNANRWGAGAWSGKCVRSNGASVVNLLSPVPSIGGMFNVLDTFNWSSMLPVMEQFPGSIGVGPSWWDAYNLVGSQTGGGYRHSKRMDHYVR
ncbi:hypothetical protein Ndes2526B_g03785 [Nannochloris sp. 'desiccata']